MGKLGMMNSLTWLLGGSVPRNRADLERLLLLAGHNSDTFVDSELEMLRKVLSLPQVKVEEVMIPHGKVDWLNADDKYSEVLEKVTTNRHSRYPVIDTDKETVAGILHVKRLVGLGAGPDDLILKPDMLQPARTVPESKKLDSMLREFQYYRVHMVVVADEGGKPAGMVTIEDVLEHIVGAIRDEFDSQEAIKPPIRATGKQDLWDVDGETPIEKFNDHFGLELDKGKFDTVNGWIANQLGRLPQAGDELEEGNLSLKVTKTDQRRVLAVDVAMRNDGNNSQQAG